MVTYLCGTELKSSRLFAIGARPTGAQAKKLWAFRAELQRLHHDSDFGFNTVLNRILPTVVKKKGGRIPEHYRCLLNELMGNNLLLLS